MKYDTPTRLKYTLPYLKKAQTISPKAKRRLKWMDYIYKGNNIAKCSRHFDVPESTISYWYKRFNPYNLSTLEDRPKKPKNVRYSEVPLRHIKRVVQIRKKYRWDKIKIQKLLKKEGIDIGQTRIQKIINQAGLKRKKKKYRYKKRKNRKHMYSVPKQYPKKPGGLVYFDVKYLYLPEGKLVYQFTAIDHATRTLGVKVYNSKSSKNGVDFFNYVQKSLNTKICYLGSDNGSEFLGLLEKYLSEHNITHVFSSPATPKQNPFVERVIKTIIEEVYEYEGLEINLQKQQQRLDKYCFVYNKIRPHSSLDLDTPYERYVKLSKSLAM